jgi:hypothetical protein
MGKARTKHEDKRTAKHSNDASRGAAGTKAGQRDAATVRRLNMYKKRAVRDKKGKLLYQVHTFFIPTFFSMTSSRRHPCEFFVGAVPLTPTLSLYHRISSPFLSLPFLTTFMAVAITGVAIEGSAHDTHPARPALVREHARGGAKAT